MVQLNLQYDDDLLQVHVARAAAALPGPDYYTALRWIHECITPAKYVEIGVRSGESLKAARPYTRCVGIDPIPDITEPLAPNVQLFTMLSDDFFKHHQLSDVWGDNNFDLAFIDGEHLFEQALRDFIHLEQLSNPDSVIMIHDCLPLDEITSSRERLTHFYSGDVWKLALLLTTQRPDLRIATIATPPTGLCLVDHLNPNISLNWGTYVECYIQLTYEDFLTRRCDMPPTLGNTEAAVYSWLRQRGRAQSTTDF
jgi:hypothetical protein